MDGRILALVDETSQSCTNSLNLAYTVQYLFDMFHEGAVTARGLEVMEWKG